MKLTRTLAQQLDTQRRLLIGRSAILALLNHDPDKGYILDVSVLKGWTAGKASGDNAGTGDLKVKVAESTTITADKLRECAAFGLFLPGMAAAKVCLISGRQEPVGEMIRVWEFSVAPTGEPYI